MSKEPSIPKTNAMRMLDGAKIPYQVLTYAVDENDLSGMHIAVQLNFPPEQMFKTLVAKGDKTGYLVFCIPVNREIDLKAAAARTGNKKIEMVHVKDLLGLTGYIRGGCSPIGMKRAFPTYIHSSCLGLSEIYVSAGVRGLQIRIAPDALIAFTRAETADLIRKEE